MIASAGATVAAIGLTTLATQEGHTELAGTPYVINIRDHGPIPTNRDVTGIVRGIIHDAKSKNPIYSTKSAYTVIHFPAGLYRIDAGTLAFTDTVVIQGEGWGSTVVELNDNSAAASMITLGGSSSVVRNLTLSGRASRLQTNTQDLLSVNAPHCLVENVLLRSATGSGIVVGQAGSAICSQFNNILIRECQEYGIHIAKKDGTKSTDCMWSSIDIGNCGRSGVLIESPAQNFVNLHVWGSGIQSTSDVDGVRVQAGSCQFSNLQCETNQGSGLRVDAGGGSLRSTIVASGKMWANRNNGVYLTGGVSLSMIDVVCFNNGTFNDPVTTSNRAAAVWVEDSSRNAIRVVAYDTGGTLEDKTKSYATGASNPFVGRTAVQTQNYGIVESGTSDYNQFSGLVSAGLNGIESAKALATHTNTSALQTG